MGPNGLDRPGTGENPCPIRGDLEDGVNFEDPVEPGGAQEPWEVLVIVDQAQPSVAGQHPVACPAQGRQSRAVDEGHLGQVDHQVRVRAARQ